MTTPPNPARRCTLTHYLAGAAGTTALLAATPQADAAVVAVNIGTGTTISAGGNDVTNTATSTSLGFLNGYTMNNFYVGNLSGGPSAVYRSGTWYAQFLDNGTAVGDGSLLNASLGLGAAYFRKSGGSVFSTDVSGNIGFQTSDGNWGWANVAWDRAGRTLTVNSAYVESVSGAPITVGDVGAVPEPSRALLALAGLGTVMLRRRRKQAA
ncbi:MAG: PEP-CTERM sorting domain-containing protein [Prosthecobacter sp.]